MGVDPRFISGSLRLSLGHTTSEQDIDRASSALIAAVNRLRRNKTMARVSVSK